MKRKKEEHSFHIPVMGLGFTVDSPIKVAHYGISSVISIVDDLLMEKMRKFYSENLKMHFEDISDKIEDFRAKRTTAYLNLVDNADHGSLNSGVIDPSSPLLPDRPL